jgi:hypothetical protein
MMLQRPPLSIGTPFVCDECGKPGVRESPNQKRHDGRCRRAHAIKAKRLGRNQGLRDRIRRRTARA